ncbi:hypothetical protein BC936DRAFT_139960 [Jimgerdemannia flammicorona]|uniref:Uncharacterized protein n=1 Tax=Jimgerdemannia flammicorona TaxID=994334 RepID=A0A433DH74_9FUNG|nr:hypothetical protein BC936DRAFT_139960 [Jimgerdemannia flammicorona]
MSTPLSSPSSFFCAGGNLGIGDCSSVMTLRLGISGMGLSNMNPGPPGTGPPRMSMDFRTVDLRARFSCFLSAASASAVFGSLRSKSPESGSVGCRATRAGGSGGGGGGGGGGRGEPRVIVDCCGRRRGERTGVGEAVFEVGEAVLEVDEAVLVAIFGKFGGDWDEKIGEGGDIGHGEARCEEARCGEVGCGDAGRGEAGRGEAERGEAGRGEAGREGRWTVLKESARRGGGPGGGAEAGTETGTETGVGGGVEVAS